VKLVLARPVFYSSERIGKEGRLFRCTSFGPLRSGRREAPRRSDAHERARWVTVQDFERSTDYQVGRFSAQYSLDELPQSSMFCAGHEYCRSSPTYCEQVRSTTEPSAAAGRAPGITVCGSAARRILRSINTSRWMCVYRKTGHLADMKIIIRTVAVGICWTGS